MNRDAFSAFLQGRNVPHEKLDEFVSVAEWFEKHLEPSGQPRTHVPTSGDVEAFARVLIREGHNTEDSFFAVARYGQFLGNHEVYRTAIELIDGGEVLENLYKKLGEQVGEKKRDEIFGGIELPPLGTATSAKPRITQVIMDRLEKAVDAETCKALLSGCLRTLEDAWFLEDQKKYLESGDLDKYLVRKGREFIARLEQLKSEGKTFYTQEVTDEVIGFVREHPEISRGIRDGDVLYEAKIPYMTQQYLTASDERMKRYYACHCPWVRESIKTGDVAVSPTFCLCSAGFVKKPWEVILGEPLQAEVVESVLKGDLWCKIAIHLPHNVVEKVARGERGRI